MTNSVRSGSTARATASTAAGSVLSSTDRDGFAKLDASTSGARLDPPIPHTIVRVRPSRRAASAKRTSSSHCASETCGAVVQARRFIWPRNLTPSRWVACTVRLAASVVPSLNRQTRALVAIAAGSFLAIVLAYLLTPAPRRTLVAAVSWTWATVYAIACCVVAARRHPSSDQRRAWVWIGAGCVLFLAGQLVWTYYEVVLGGTPPYPSLADVGFLGVYVCFLAAVTKLVGAEPRRRFDHELLIDTVLVTLTAGALAYEFFLKPLFAVVGSVPSLLTSIAWSIGGLPPLWVILVGLLRPTPGSPAPAGGGRDQKRVVPRARRGECRARRAGGRDHRATTGPFHPRRPALRGAARERGREPDPVADGFARGHSGRGAQSAARHKRLA